MKTETPTQGQQLQRPDVLTALRYDVCEAVEKCEPCKGARQMAIAEIVRLRQELEAAADMLHECATKCAACNYGHGAIGTASEGAPCEECAPIREAERRARAAIGAQP